MTNLHSGILFPMDNHTLGPQVLTFWINHLVPYTISKTSQHSNAQSEAGLFPKDLGTSPRRNMYIIPR